MSSGIESPQSISSIIYYRGVGMTITAREAEVKMNPLIEEQMKRIDWLLDEVGCLPSWNKQTNDEVKELPRPKPIMHTEQKPIGIGEFQDKCEKCGADKILSKKGNMVCKNFCWTK